MVVYSSNFTTCRIIKELEYITICNMSSWYMWYVQNCFIKSLLTCYMYNTAADVHDIMYLHV